MKEQAKVAKIEETKEKYKRNVIIEFKGNEYPVELDTTPYRKDGEEYDTYKERMKTIEYFLKLEKKKYVFKSLSNAEKLVGIKGKTYKKEENEQK